MTQKDSISSFYELGQSQLCTVDIISRGAVKKTLFLVTIFEDGQAYQYVFLFRLTQHAAGLKETKKKST